MAITTGLLVLPALSSDRLVALAKTAERTGYDYFWIADERFFREVYVGLALCAAHTERILLGPCVTDPYSRHPALTAMAIASLDEASNRRAVLGIGAGVSGFRELGIKRERSGRAIQEAVELIRRLLTGETVTYKGETVAFDHGQLDFKPVRADVPIFVASQHPIGCRVAGRVADGAMMQGCMAEPLLTFFRETVAAGAREAGRDPSTLEMAARVNVCVHDDRRAAREIMKPTIVRSMASQRPEFFTFTKAGLTIPDALRAKLEGLHYSHDPGPAKAIAADLPESFVDAITLAGPPDEVAAGVIRLARSGITQFTIYPMSPDGRVETTVERFQAEVMPRVRAAGC